MKSKFPLLGSFAAGLINAALGTGGGMIMVPILKRSGLEQKQAHATSISVILPICVFSATLYLFNRQITLAAASPYILYGIAGAVLGTFVLKRINHIFLRRVLAVFILVAGVRLLIK